MCQETKSHHSGEENDVLGELNLNLNQNERNKKKDCFYSQHINATAENNCDFLKQMKVIRQKTQRFIGL